MKLIDRDVLLSYRFKNPISYQAFANLVKRVDTIDLVTCGECKWKYLQDSVWVCTWGLLIPNDKGFCSYGERKSE